MNVKLKYIFAAIVFIGIGLLCFCVPQYLCKYKEELNLFGALSSIIGIVFVIIQLCHAESIAKATAEKTEIIKNQADIIANHAEDTKNAIEKSLYRTNRIITIAEVSQIVHLPNEIQDALQNSDLGRAYEKMRNLKDALIELKTAPQFQEEAVALELSNIMAEINIRLKSLSKAIKEKTNTMYAQDKTIDLMEKTRAFIMYQSTIMKRQNLE